MSLFNQKLESLEQFVGLLFESLGVANSCKMLLFPASVREEFSINFEEKYSHNEEKTRILNFLTTNDYYGELELAGLQGTELTYKLAEISDSALSFYTNGGVANFSRLLKKSLILLKSLIGAIPAIGSALQELIDFIEQRVKDLTVT